MCAPKTMVKIGIAIVAALAIGWFAVPQFRSSFIAIAPFAIIAICPLAMLFGMHGREEHGEHSTSSGHSSGGGCCGKKDDVHAKPSEWK